MSKNYIVEFHQAKLDFVDSKGAYASVSQNLLNDCQTDTATIGRVVLEVLNADYPVIDTRDNKVLKTALDSFQNSLRVAGELLADGIGGKLVFKFSTAGGKDNKVRTVSVEHLSQNQVDTIAERVLQDAAIEAERAETDEKLATEKRETERDNMYDLDVFLRVKQYMTDTFPNADVKAMLSAGMAWVDQQELNALTDVEAEQQRANG